MYDINKTIINDVVRQAWQQTRSDSMSYITGMEVIDETLMHKVISAREAYKPNEYTAIDVEEALQADRLSWKNFGALLSPAAKPYLEAMAQKAKAVKEAYFGNGIQLFTPLYLSNYCENYCVYCGFNCHNTIKRAALNRDEIEREMQAIASTGLQEILLLTGESRSMSDIPYISEACQIARKYFRVIGLEIYPVNSEEYALLHQCGADYVTVFQETYDSLVYEQLHLAGAKRIFPYRFHAQERALRGGMRGVGFAALLGLADFRKDAYATGIHARLLQQAYPHAEVAFSCPRLRPIKNNTSITATGIGEAELLQIVCAYRLLIPSASITVSTRECARVRNAMASIAANKLSAGVSTGIGTHSEKTNHDGDAQFEIADGRSVSEVCADLEKLGLQPVPVDYIYV